MIHNNAELAIQLAFALDLNFRVGRLTSIFSPNHMPLSTLFTDSPSAGQSPRLSAVMVAVALLVTPRSSSTPTRPRLFLADTAVFLSYVHSSCFVYSQSSDNCLHFIGP